MPLRFTDATGALFYTEDVSATGGGGMHSIIIPCMHDVIKLYGKIGSQLQTRGIGTICLGMMKVH